MENDPIPTAEELVRRCLTSLRSYCLPTYRWVTVRDLFGTGKTTAHAICRAYGFDPDEVLPANHCDGCRCGKGADEGDDEDGE